VLSCWVFFPVQPEGIMGAMVLMLSHGIVSSALFICVGIIYERYHTRILRDLSGLSYIMPKFAFCFFLLSFGNISFPSTFGFVGEFLVFFAITTQNTTTSFLALSNVLLGAAYTLWLLTRLLFGPLSSSIQKFSDVNQREASILIYLIIFMSILGIKPDTLVNYLDTDILFIHYKTIIHNFSFDITKIDQMVSDFGNYSLEYRPYSFHEYKFKLVSYYYNVAFNPFLLYVPLEYYFNYNPPLEEFLKEKGIQNYPPNYYIPTNIQERWYKKGEILPIIKTPPTGFFYLFVKK